MSQKSLSERAAEAGISTRQMIRRDRAAGIAPIKGRPKPITQRQAILAMLEDDAGYAETARTFGHSSTRLRLEFPGYQMSKEGVALKARAMRWGARALQI